jgi:hypothetical protein
MAGFHRLVEHDVLVADRTTAERSKVEAIAGPEALLLAPVGIFNIGWGSMVVPKDLLGREDVFLIEGIHSGGK